MSNRRSKACRRGKSVLAACESRRDCSVKRRDEILSEKNDQKVSAMEGDGMEL